MSAAELDRWLSQMELVRLTKRTQRAAQCRRLAAMGVPFEVGADGEPLVDATRYFAAPKAPRKARQTEPNWKAIRGPKAS
jgi:hypothetical protein